VGEGVMKGGEWEGGVGRERGWGKEGEEENKV